LNEIPFDEMWEDDKIWLPLLLNDKKFDAEFLFDDKMEKILCYRIFLKD